VNMEQLCREPINVNNADLGQLLNQRHSCRGFLSDQVPAETITKIFEMAQQAASWCNTQPWQVHVTSGEGTVRFANGLSEYATLSAVQPHFPMPLDYTGVYQERRRESGFALYNALGIGRSDRAGRAEQAQRNFSLFGAPHTAIITTDAAQGVYGAIDCGGYIATLLLAAKSLGVATVAQASVAMYSEYVKSFLDLPADRRVVCAVSFGFEDSQHPANSFRTTRATPSDVLRIIDS
jgi:nitroreductase